MDEMATYTAVVSVMQDLEEHLTAFDTIFRSSELELSPFSKRDIQKLYDAVSLMDSFLRDSSGLSYSRRLTHHTLLNKRITSVSLTVGTYIDYWAVQCLSGVKFSEEVIAKIGVPLTKMMKEIISINRELNKIQDLEDPSSTASKSSTSSSPSRRPANTEGKLVGLEKDSVMMLERLTGHPSKLQVISVIGMGGVGKTTFTKNLYNDPLAIHHFYVRAWVTVSQQYQVKEMLLGVLHCVTNVSDEMYAGSNEELRERVYRNLKGKRYLIALDDIWDTKAWDELKRALPDDKNGSRIILTSRLRAVAVHASQDTPPHLVHCLSKEDGWELLISKIFVGETCPPELEAIGKQIAYKCQGLPLAIVVVGGLLSKMNKKLDVWEEVSDNVASLVMEEAGKCQNILALSYVYLPDHLKQCFLYMGVFPEDYEVSVKKLIWLWVAEGFIRPRFLKSLEEVAEDYIEDLTTRSLILVKRTGSDGSIKTCYIHDMMRELCLRESKRQNFFQVINAHGKLPLLNPLEPHDATARQVSPNHRHYTRRLSFHSSIHILNTTVPYARSFMCFEKLSPSYPQSYFGMNVKLLKVFDLMSIHLAKIPADIMRLTLLKFLGLTIKYLRDINSLFKFCCLQTIVLDCEWDGYLPRKFWDMQELRHFHLKRSCSSNSSSTQSSSTAVLEPVDAELPLRVLSNLRSVSNQLYREKLSLHAPS